MGVPRLWGWMAEHYPEAIEQILLGECHGEVDHLFIDSNPFIHQAAQRVYNYGNEKVLVRHTCDDGPQTEEEKFAAIFETYFELILEIAKTTPPRKTLYIAIDGTAPFAKQVQQRQRRFLSIRDQCPFITSHISPGTRFMQSLQSAFDLKLKSGGLEQLVQKGCQVIFSHALIPGEGEHKIMDYIRSMPSSARRRETMVFDGPDGDLIMLCLCLKHYNIVENLYLLKGVLGSKTQMYLVDYRQIAMSNVPDFIMKGFFVGNDFLPKIKMFYFLEDGLEMMLSSQTKLDGGLETLTALVTEMAAKEKEFLERQARLSTRDLEDLRLEDTTLKSCLDHSPDNRPGPKGPMGSRQGSHHGAPRLDYQRYRKLYYSRYEITTAQQVEDMCEDYVRGIMWVYEYYTRSLCDWNYSYKYHIPPLMIDLKQYLTRVLTTSATGSGRSSSRDSLMTFAKTKPATPFVQLLCILPPTLKNFLPPEYAVLMDTTTVDKPTDRRSVLVQKGYYQTDFEVDYEGKSKLYQGVAKLPMIDRQLVIREYRRIRPQGTYKRNRILSFPKVYTR